MRFFVLYNRSPLTQLSQESYSSSDGVSDYHLVLISLRADIAAARVGVIV